MRVAATGVLVTLALLATSCASEAGTADQPASANGPANGEPLAAEVVPVDPADTEFAAEVNLTGFSFQPDTVEIDVGDTVRWTNADATRHTATAGADAEPTGAFHLTLDDRGDSAGLRFTEPGEYRYFCTPHPFMQGTITVSG